ncbi:MAG: aconitase family protein, partial [Gammaproteobacteria bacterium]|nr:aconitase family protein [Gammaproteobacteria bacterium]
VMAPELGIAQPGLTIVCGDSHTATLGGVGALAWGIGVTQGEHALSTRCLPVKRPNQVLVNLEGTLPEAVSAKDIVLRLSAVEGGSVTKADAVEFAGSAIRAMSVEGRMTLCNMAVEFGCWTAVVAPDEKTHSYLRNGRYAPKGELWEQAVAHWSALKSDGDARFHKVISIDVSGLRPQVTWGTSSDHVVSIDGAVPILTEEADATKRESMRQAMEYMGLPEGTGLRGLPIEAAFIGSCTNGRIEDLRAAAEQLRGRRVAVGIKALCVPGSAAVKRQAQAEGLDELFKGAGFEWREPGCSLCFYAGGETFGANKRVISTTNRNFQNRQGPGVKTHLASPATVAASAVAGRIVPPSPSR